MQWKKPAAAPFPASDDLFNYIRATTPSSSGKPSVAGNPDAALAGAATRVEADYDVPFQGHTAFGPAHATADPTNDQLTIYSNDMKSYGMRNGVAEFLKMPRDRVRVIWMDGPQGYGRTAADDAGFEAAFLAKEIGRPVRVQWMRDEETAWDTKGPAYAFTMRGGLDASGNLVALDYDARAADHCHLGYNEHDTVLIAQLAGMRRAEPARGRASLPSDMYVIPNKRSTTAVIPLPLVWETPLRTGNLRDPDGPQVTFASESFIDELAAAAKADPLEFRLKLLSGGDDRRQRVQARAIDCVLESCGRGVWMGAAAVTEIARHRERPHRPRRRLCLSQPDCRGRNRGGRSRSPDRPGLGEAARLRARLRAGHQPGGAQADDRMRHAPLGEPRAATKRCGSTPRRSPASTGDRHRRSPTPIRRSGSTS